ncbi:MAG: error-prone DNA polymerase [Betaproteobacteria bacterium]|nr:error-prone DNA polymerase [Betaproteobacteria bacterium]
MLPDYAELHCVSNFTFLRGASHPDELVARAAGLGYTALAMTDECSLAGVVRAHVAAKAHQLKLIVGAEFRLVGGPGIVLLASDRDAYGNLSELITTARRRSEKGSYSLQWDDLSAGLDGCLAILIPPALPASTLPSPAMAGEGPLQDATRIAEYFPRRAWIAAELLCGPDDRKLLCELQELSRASGLPLVAAGDVHMHVRSRRALQDTLTAIRCGTTVASARQALYPNAERHLRMRVRLAQLYPPELLAETVQIAERCNFSLDSLRYEYPDELVPAGHTPASYLRELAEAGLRTRFAQGVPEHVRKLVERELALIAELGYEPYFLTVCDIVTFARSRGILCQGRGSAANSAVCYALGITAVDPARMNMLFERFISKERNEPPDIDVDFEHQRREEVIQYLYRKYGRDRAALTATVITYRPRSALRDVGKALGLDLQQVDQISQSLAWWDGGKVLAQRLSESGFDPGSHRIANLLALATTLLGFPRHLSQHTGGFVIARGKLSRLVPIENAAMPERSVIEWDKDDLDALGLLKVDVLALGMLSAIRRALDLIGLWRGAPFGMTDVPPEDPRVYAMIQRADTVGVFQIESRAQMSMLPRLKPKSFYDLVIEVAIVRPGPIQGGMVHPYLRRRQGLEPVTYPSEAVSSVLSRTLGVPIFQEQVMQLAVVAAGFTPGESDQLRRSMAAWRRKGGLEHFEQRLTSGMLARGYRRDFAAQIYQQILGFGEYGFPESHSASFALLVYVSAWIKCHEPAAFLAALLNSQPMGFYAPAQLLQDARRHGVEVLPVDVTSSAWDCTLERTRTDTPAVRLGLRMVGGLAEDSAQRLVAARESGNFISIDELARRAALDRRALNQLAAAGALAALSGHRRIAHWQVAGVEQPIALFKDAPLVETLPGFAAPSEGEDLVADYASLGLTLGRHPLALLRPRLQRMRLSTAAELRGFPHGRLARAAGIVIGRQHPDTASGVVFVTLEDETGSINVIVWRDVGEAQRRELLGSRLLAVHGVLERQGEVVHLIARRLVDHSVLLGKLATASRDFH